MTKSDKPPKPNAAEARDAKLAQALKANLARRKAAKPPKGA